jgi:hypothetical protein
MVHLRLEFKKRRSVMKTLAKNATKWMTAIVIPLFGLFLGTVQEARAAELACSQNSPMVKNLMALSYRAPCAQAAVPQGLTKDKVKRLAATAESREGHLKLVRYYKAQADMLDVQAAGYEEAAAGYRRGPIVKNLMAPSTAGRYEFFAKGFRDKAKSDRALADHTRKWRRRPSRTLTKVSGTLLPVMAAPAATEPADAALPGIRVSLGI